MDSNRRNINRKREDYIDWHDYFMATAFLAAKRSKDPCSQVGACIVNEDKKVVGVGYNGMPTGCSDDEFPWAKESNDPQDNKYYYVCHAEVNAVLNKNCADVKNCTIYVGLFPCNECAKVIIQAGIKEVIYLSDKHSHKASTMASKRMLDAANVKYWQYVPQSSKIVIDFNEIDWNDMNQLSQTPKKSNDKVDDDLIEPIRDMTLNDSVTDNHSKSLDYISGSTEKGKISEVNKGYSTLLQDALSNRPASNQSLLLNIMTMLCHMVERSEEQTEVLRKQNNQLSDDFAVLKLMMQGLLEARPGRNLVAEAPEFLPEGSVQQAATKKRPPVSKPIKELVPTLAPLGYSENKTILDLSKVERVKIRYREALEAAGKRQSVGRAMLCRIILHESIPALPVDDNVSEFETLRRAVELYILKIQDKRMYLKKRAEYCPDIAEDS